jgi:hypothetical protein
MITQNRRLLQNCESRSSLVFDPVSWSVRHHWQYSLYSLCVRLDRLDVERRPVVLPGRLAVQLLAVKRIPSLLVLKDLGKFILGGRLEKEQKGWHETYVKYLNL